MFELHQKYIHEISTLNRYIQGFLQDKDKEVVHHKDQCNSYKQTIQNLKRDLQDNEQRRIKDEKINNQMKLDFKERITELNKQVS